MLLSTLRSFLVYDLAVLIVILAYPFIFWKVRSRRRVKANTSAVKHADQSTSSRGVPSGTRTGDTESHSIIDVAAGAPEKARGRTLRFRVLTVMTISVAVCYTPASGYYTTLAYVAPDMFWVNLCYFIFALEAVFDPLWFILTLKDLRRCFLNLIRNRAATQPTPGTHHLSTISCHQQNHFCC